MASTVKYHVFTDCDLDGAGSYLVYSWFNKVKSTYTTCRVNDLKTTYKNWASKNNINDYETVYFFDLDVAQDDELISLIDRDNVIIVDHHKSHIERSHVYKNAKTHIVEYTSTTRLLYKIFSESMDGVTLTDAQKLLILMVDDYDSYKLVVPNSYEMNILFWSLTGDRLLKYITDFKIGFTGFNEQHKNMISFYLKKLANIKKDLDVHLANIPIKGTTYKIVVAFADSCINDIADHIIKNYKSDIGMVVNVKTNKVSLRKDQSCEVDLSKLSKTLFDSGGGHEFAAGGLLCDKFLDFAKLFTPLKLKIGT
jgi:oligoribonuclease NrnB/cAMP/cGMP phosphodiesterase (DHH superfamily)